MAMAQQSIQDEIKQYLTIFVCLIVLTAVSVGIHFLHLNQTLSIILILSVAVIQAVLSTCYLMHLISEKKLVYLALILAAIFFIGMIGLIYFGHFNKPEGTLFVS